MRVCAHHVSRVWAVVVVLCHAYIDLVFVVITLLGGFVVLIVQVDGKTVCMWTYVYVSGCA